MSLVNSAQALPVHTAANVQQIQTPPSHLRLRFTNAHDCDMIADLFHGPRKKELDPNGKVRSRSAAELEGPVSQGSAIIATDPSGKIRFFGMTSDHFKYTGNAMAITEIGGIMSDLRGFKLTQIASAMLALRESIRLRESFPCIASFGIHALVAKDNPAAQKVFGRDLDWENVVPFDQRRSLFDTQGKYSCPQTQASKLWFSFQASALNSARDRVAKTIARSALYSRDGQTIPIDLDPRAHELL